MWELAVMIAALFVWGGCAIGVAIHEIGEIDNPFRSGR